MLRRTILNPQQLDGNNLEQAVDFHTYNSTKNQRNELWEDQNRLQSISQQIF